MSERKEPTPQYEWTISGGSSEVDDWRVEVDTGTLVRSLRKTSSISVPPLTGLISGSIDER